MSRLEHSWQANVGLSRVPIRMFHVKHTHASHVVGASHIAGQDTVPIWTNREAPSAFPAASQLGRASRDDGRRPRCFGSCLALR
jgi:hypothetical protein